MPPYDATTAGRLARDGQTPLVIGVMLIGGYALFFVLVWLKGDWLHDTDGGIIVNDFVNVWAAGHLVLEGQAAAAYDWTVHKQAEIAAVGYAFDGYYGWHYPPAFLFVAALLATLPYTLSYLAWMAIGLPAYAGAIALIVRDRAAAVLVCAFPAVMWNVSAGQNGFVTTALIGGTLGLMQRHPVLAGCCLGLLTYKPQFGLLFPLALIAARQWRMIAAAAGVGGLLAAASWFAYGIEAWQAFAQSGQMVTQAVLTEGRGDWGKLQSVFGLVRRFGGSETLAWSGQIAITTAGAAAVWASWRSHAPFALKAATLAVAAVLATPYLFVYDLVALTVPIAFLVRHAGAAGFRRWELPSILAAAALVLAFPAVTLPLGLAASLIIAGLIAIRIAETTAPA